MNCENCNCPLTNNDSRLCDLCEEEIKEQERADQKEYEEQIEKAFKFGIPIDKLHEVVQLIYFE
jgi:predicted amidophosphoribosyltransferase